MKQRRPGTKGSRFFAAGAILIAAVVVASFMKSYFVPLAIGGKGFSLLRHLHGAAFFAWIGLYLWQTRLVRSGRVARHRELGIAGVALGGAMLPLGIWQTVAAAGERAAGGMALPFEFSIYNLVDILVFSIAFGWAVSEAGRRIDWHRRLMFIAALNLLGPAFSRIIFMLPLPYPWIDMAPSLVADAGLLALAWHDRAESGRIHPVTLGALLLLVPIHAAQPFVARSAAWNAIAPTLFGFS